MNVIRQFPLTLTAQLPLASFLLLWACIFANAGEYKLTDTGIFKCYDNERGIACPQPGDRFYGQDAQYDGLEPAYQDNGDGTVSDLNTGLMWQQGKIRRALQGARDYCAASTLAGYSDWRLPDIGELLSIVDYGRSDPAIHTGYFPNCYSMPFTEYWSSSPFAYATTIAWVVEFSSGMAGPFPDFADNYVRCVRGEPVTSPVFHDNDDGTVSDSVTGLMWQKSCPLRSYTWEEALSYCESNNLCGYTDWRLPNVRELLSLWDWTRMNPPIDLVFDCSETYYWTSSTSAAASSYAWNVFFGTYGATGPRHKTFRPYDRDVVRKTRCVRGGQGPTPVTVDVKANGLDEPFFTHPGEPVPISLLIDPGDMAGTQADWWGFVLSSYGSFSLIDIQAPIFEFSETILFNMPLPVGWHIFLFALDDVPDGAFELDWYDYVVVVSQPAGVQLENIPNLE